MTVYGWYLAWYAEAGTQTGVGAGSRSGAGLVARLGLEANLGLVTGMELELRLNLGLAFSLKWVKADIAQLECLEQSYRLFSPQKIWRANIMEN